MKQVKYTDEFLRIAQYIEEDEEFPYRGLFTGKVFTKLDIPRESLGEEYRVAVSITINEISPEYSYFDPALDYAVRPLLFCFLHAILSSGDSLCTP